MDARSRLSIRPPVRDTAGAVVGAVAATVFLALATVTAQAESPPPAAPASGSPAAPGDAAPMPAGTGPLDPGAYVTSALGVDLTLTVPEGWEIANEEVEGVGIDLAPSGFVAAGPVSVAFMGFTRFDGEVFEGDCVPHGMDEAEYLERRRPIEASAASLVDHLRANQYLTVGDPVAVELGGHRGLQVDATASLGQECNPEADFETHLWAIPVFGSWVLGDGMAARYIALDVDGGVIVIVLEHSSDVDVESFEERAQVILDTVVLTPSGG